jgi:hypothetical protein
MKKVLFLFLIICLSNDLYSQNGFSKKGDYESYKKEMDSLSKVYKKDVTGYWYSSIQNKSKLTIFYNENKKQKDTTFLYTPSF